MANNFSPQVDAKASIVELGQEILASRLFTVSDLDPNSIVTRYRVRDNSILNYSGFFTVNRVRQAANTWIEFASSKLNTVKFKAAIQQSNESFSVQVYDGARWSNVDSAIMYSVNPNRNRPVVAANNGTVLETEGLSIESLFNVTDADGSPILRYYFVDRKLNQNGGYFQFNGNRLPSANWFIVEADQLNQLRYVGGAFGFQSESIGIRAFDGKFWSVTKNVSVTTRPNQHRPVLNAFNVNMPTGQSLATASLFSWTDQDGNSPKFFAFFDTGPSSGHFSVNGVAQPAMQWFTVKGDQLSSVRYNSSTNGSAENYRVRVFDGRYWSVVDAANIRQIPRPRIEVVDPDHELQVDELERINVSTLISKVDGGPSHVRYNVMDATATNGSGKLYEGRDTLEENVVHTLNPTQFANLRYEGGIKDFGRQVDEIKVQANNGLFWTEWQTIRINTDPRGDDALRFPFDPNWTPYWDGEKTVVPYSFITGDMPGNSSPAPLYYGCPLDSPDAPPPAAPSECDTSTPLDAAMRASFRRVLEFTEQLVDIDFVEVPYNDVWARNSIMVIGLHNHDGLNNVIGHAYPPEAGFDPVPGRSGFGRTVTCAIDIRSCLGDVWFDVADFIPNQTDASPGSLFQSTAIHEIGHALGLKHTFDHVVPNGKILPNSTDYQHNSIMSYTRLPGFHAEEASTWMLYDIWQLQQYYNINVDHNRGNDHYFWAPDDSHLQAIADGGGIDTLNFTRSRQNETIDLHQGTYSTLNGVANSLLIPYDVVIENARGGFGSDVIQGNGVRNLLFGNHGHDQLFGNAGNDVLRGGHGNDTYIWDLGDGRDTIREDGTSGVDIIEIYDVNKLNSLEDDFTFRRFGNDLRIDMTFDQGPGNGTVVVKNQGFGSWQVEKLRLFGETGEQIGQDIDLTSIFLQADTRGRRFQVTSNNGAFGAIAVPVS